MVEKYDETVAKEMIRIRIAQMIVNEEYKKGNFKIPIHLALGHESLAVAINKIMEKNDKLLLSHRNIEYNLARSDSFKKILNEYFLKKEGLKEGKLGSMNLINQKNGLIYSSSILGNNFAVASGVAMAEKISGRNGLTIVLGGDGSLEEGSFHETMLLIKSLQLPTMIIIENNEWSMATRIHERRHPVNLEKFCEAFDVKYVKLSGNNPFEYIEKLKKLRQNSISNMEPVCIEVMLTTLGDWIMDSPEHPDGKFINYHAGPAPKIDLQEGIIIKKGIEDPLNVLTELFSKSKIDEIIMNEKMKIEEELCNI